MKEVRKLLLDGIGFHLCCLINLIKSSGTEKFNKDDIQVILNKVWADMNE
jgi:hypothetical protein